MWPFINKEPATPFASPMYDACWKIKTRLQPFMANISCPVIAITSAGKSEGKTTAAINLASVYAQHNNRVLLIDANLRKPALHKLFGLSNRSGLTNLLTDGLEINEVIRRSQANNLSLITTGSNPVHPVQMLTSNRWSCLINDLKQEYDVIFIDTPAALEWPDAYMAASACDGVLLVIKEAAVKQERAAMVKKGMEQIDAKVIGALLNGVSHRNLIN